MQAVPDSGLQSRSRRRQPGDWGNRFDSRRRPASERRPIGPQLARSDRAHGRHAVHANHRALRNGAAEGGVKAKRARAQVASGAVEYTQLEKHMSQLTPEVSKLLEQALSLSVEEQEVLANSLISNLGGVADDVP